MSEMSSKQPGFSDQIARFKNIEIAPRVGTGVWKATAGPIWPDWDNQTFPRFHVHYNPIDTKPASGWSTGDPVLEKGFWCGAYFNNFGHVISDHSTRLLLSHKIDPKLPKIFSTFVNLEKRPVTRSKHKLLNVICNWYGVNLDSVIVINTPTMVKKLTVVAQQETTKGWGPNERYLDLLDANAKRVLGTVPSIPLVYVSRSKQQGGILGEAYLEKVFEQAGGLVIRPEELPLERQMEIYSGARKLVFCEGSAVHGLQLLGRLPAEVIILKRRDHKFCVKALTPRAQALHYVEVGGELRFYFKPGLDYEKLNNRRDTKFVDSDKFLAAMNELDIPISKYWDEKEYCRVAEEHLIKETDKFVEVWSKNRSKALRDEFFSLVLSSRFQNMAPLLKKRFSEN